MRQIEAHCNPVWNHCFRDWMKKPLIGDIDTWFSGLVFIARLWWLKWWWCGFDTTDDLHRPFEFIAKLFYFNFFGIFSQLKFHYSIAFIHWKNNLEMKTKIGISNANSSNKHFTFILKNTNLKTFSIS